MISCKTSEDASYGIQGSGDDGLSPFLKKAATGFPSQPCGSRTTSHNLEHDADKTGIFKHCRESIVPTLFRIFDNSRSNNIMDRQ